jgi:tetratricopeptide (TPR) repeat protein
MVFAALSTDAANREALEDAVELGQASVESFTRAGDVRNASNTRMNAAYLLMLLGQYKRAEKELREGLASAERAGLVTIASLARHNLGPTLLRSGDRESAERYEREAIRDYDAQGNRRLRGASRFYLGRILIAQDRLEEAEAEMRLACADAETIPAMLPLVRAGLAFALLARGKSDEAFAEAKDAVTKSQERNGAVEEPNTIKLAYVEALIATKRAMDAAKILGALSVELLEQASRLRDPELRRTFLHDIADHARVFALQKGLAQTE